jgi:hypothetical protein
LPDFRRQGPQRRILVARWPTTRVRLQGQDLGGSGIRRRTGGSEDGCRCCAGTLDWSPDGRKIAFSGESGMESEFWFMENFLPVAKEAPGASARQIKK